MTQAKREAIAKAKAESEKQVEKAVVTSLSKIVNKSGFISLNSTKGSARTFTEAEGKTMFNYDTNDQSTMVIHSSGTVKGSGTVVIKDTEADDGDDALGRASDTVIIRDGQGQSGTVVIKN